MHSLSALTLVKLAVILLGALNVVLTFTSRSPTHLPRRLHITNHPSLNLLHLPVPPSPLRTLLTEETVHYPTNGTLADLEWASLVPSANHGLVFFPDADSGEPRPYAITMFHTLHCLDRIRRAIVGLPGPEPDAAREPPAHAAFHVHHCFNYVRQMVLCAANTRLNAPNHVLPTGQLATDGIGLAYECRDWERVYEAFEANAAAYGERTVG